MRIALFSVIILAVTPQFASAQMMDAEQPLVISQFSGKPVPRFVSLRYAAANGRLGPSLDYPIVWRYERQGLPVLILKESQDWRRVRDPDGDEVWIHNRMLAPRKTVMVRAESLLRKSPEADSAAIAILQPGVVGTLDRCGQGWCRIEASDRQGWVVRTQLWGSDPAETGL